MDIKSEDLVIEAREDIIGIFPIRSEITVIPADENKNLKLGWKCYEQKGGEIFKASQLNLKDGEEITLKKIRELVKPDMEAEKEGIFRDIGSLTNFDDIKVGDRIICGGFFGWLLPVISEIDEKDQTAIAEDEGNVYWLEFAKDDRKCWINWGQANKKAIEMINFGSEEGETI